MERPTVAIITDDAASANALTRRWLTEREIPAFVLIPSDSGFESRLEFDLAVVIRINPEQLALVGDVLKSAGKPVIWISSPNETSPRGQNLVALPEVVEWPELVVVVARQALHHERAKADLEHTQQLNSELEREASLGRYMLEVRHNLNNALTSVLGNSDLILLDSEPLSPSMRSQMETIRNMGMRMNEILQRFSSLEKEMQLIEQQGKVRSVTAGGS